MHRFYFHEYQHEKVAHIVELYELEKKHHLTSFDMQNHLELIFQLIGFQFRFTSSGLSYVLWVTLELQSMLHVASNDPSISSLPHPGALPKYQLH